MKSLWLAGLSIGWINIAYCVVKIDSGGIFC